MKGIIIYTSRTSTTKKCSNLLKERLGFTAVNLREKKVNLANYDVVIIGTFIRMGMIDRVIKKFLNDNKKILLNKQCAYFLCCGNPENVDKYFYMNYPQELIETAIIKETFGSCIDKDNLKGLDKFVIKMVSKDPNNGMKDEIIEKNIEKFVNRMEQVK